MTCCVNPLDYHFMSPHTNAMGDVFTDPFVYGYGNMPREHRRHSL